MTAPTCDCRQRTDSCDPEQCTVSRVQELHRRTCDQCWFNLAVRFKVNWKGVRRGNDHKTDSEKRKAT